MWLKILFATVSLATTTAALSYFAVNFYTMVGVSISLFGAYVSYRSFTISRENSVRQRQEQERTDLNYSLKVLRDEFSNDLKELKSDFSADLKELKDSYNTNNNNSQRHGRQSLEKINALLSEFTIHIRTPGHPGMIEEVKKLKEEIAILKEISALSTAFKHTYSSAKPQEKQEEILDRLDRLEQYLSSIHKD
ncbi:MAG: hypothetical protein V7L23_15385 [Nostoc sp.]|uniref:hypothetical protein n=1 Tax=Nostoc sp. TaxID=1180 RepID=UPI002FF340D3